MVLITGASLSRAITRPLIEYSWLMENGNAHANIILPSTGYAVISWQCFFGLISR